MIAAGYCGKGVLVLTPVRLNGPSPMQKSVVEGPHMRQLRALLIFLAVGAWGHAQTFRGAINGSVTDPSGAVVPKAAVAAEDTATGVEHSTVTTSDGQFAVQDLPLGTYKLTITASGFAVSTTDNIAASAGTIYTVPVKLVLAQSSVTVEVSAADIALDTTTEAQTTTVAGASLQNAPLNGRDFTQLIAVQPGFGGYSAGGFGSLNGTRANQMNWQIDGVDNNDLWHNIPAVNQGGVSAIAGTVLPIDAIDEFSVQTQSSPEAGRNPGGLVNLVIKSGSNAVHGSAYYYNRNEAFAAAPVFLPLDTHKPEMRNVQWGGSLGIPIVKNRTFFFGAFEKQNFTIGLQGLATEPSLAYQQAAQGVMDYYHVQENSVSAAMLKTLWPGAALQVRRPTISTARTRSTATATTASSNSTTESTTKTTCRSGGFPEKAIRWRRLAPI